MERTKPSAPPGLVQKVDQMFSRVRQLLSGSAELSPYSVASIIEAVDEVRAWMDQVKATGSFAGAEAILPVLERIDGEADALLQGKVDFGAQLASHLRELRGVLEEGVAANLLSAQHPALLKKKLEELEAQAASRSMLQNHQRAVALEGALQATLVEAAEARKLLRSRSHLR